MKRVLSILALAFAVVAMTACGGNNNNKKTGEEGGEASQETVQEAVQEQTAATKTEQKAEAKKWYEQDFYLAEKMYVAGVSITRIYARKGNIVVAKAAGEVLENLFVCTDSTRTGYLIGDKGTYAKRSEKNGFTSVDDAIYRYLKSQMSDTVFGKRIKKGDEGCTAKDTTIFGRPAYVLTKETTEDNIVVKAYAKTVMHVDKENGLPYYKWGLVKSNDQVVSQGVLFEVVEFSTNPTYEGLIMSLDGLTEIQ